MSEHLFFCAWMPKGGKGPDPSSKDVETSEATSAVAGRSNMGLLCQQAILLSRVVEAVAEKLLL